MEAIVILVCGVSVSSALCYQFRTRLKEKTQELQAARAEIKALTNRLVARQGYSPVYTNDGMPLIQYTDDAPVQILKPPFAAAEDRWEEEEKANRPPTLVEATGAVVPDLTEEQKREILNKY